MTYDRLVDNRINWTIGKIIETFPEFKREDLHKLFYQKFSDKQISMFRAMWHDWKIGGVNLEGKIKNLLDTWI